MIKDYAKSVPNHPIHCPLCRTVAPLLVLSHAGTTLRPPRCLACLSGVGRAASSIVGIGLTRSAIKKRQKLQPEAEEEE